jgi:hypothetical protein
MSKNSPAFNESFEPVSPVDIVSGVKRPRFAVIEDEKEAHSARRSVRTNSTSSTLSLKTPRITRFAEATTVHSPVKGPKDHWSPFADPPKMEEAEPKPSDVGFGYISNDTIEQQATMKSDPNGQAGTPLKSALKTPGTPGRLLNPLSPTFREEQVLEKEEGKTEVQQAKDLVWSTSVPKIPQLLTTLTENQDTGSNGQDGVAWCQFLMLTYRPLHAEYNLFNLQRNKSNPATKQSPGLGLGLITHSPNHPTRHLLRLSCILGIHLLGLLERRSQASREDSSLLYHLRRRFLHVQQRDVGRWRRHPPWRKNKRQRPRSLGLVLQRQQETATLPAASSLCFNMPPSKLESHLLCHRSRCGDNHNRHLRNRLLPLLLQEPPEEEHGRARQSPLRPLPCATENSERPKYTWLRRGTDTALSTLPCHDESRPL